MTPAVAATTGTVSEDEGNHVLNFPDTLQFSRFSEAPLLPTYLPTYLHTFLDAAETRLKVLDHFGGSCAKGPMVAFKASEVAA